MALLFAVCWRAPAHADDAQFGQPWRIDPDDPVGSVPGPDEANADPMAYSYFLLELARLAQEAETSGDVDQTIDMWRAISKAVPQSAHGPRKLCEHQLAAGRTHDAIVSCRVALDRNGVVVADYTTWLGLLNGLAKLDPDLVSEAKEVIAHLGERDDTALVAARSECQLGVRLEDPEMLEDCVAKLDEALPEASETAIFGWNLAVLNEDRAAALERIQRGAALGIPADAIEHMKRVTDERAGKTGVVPWLAAALAIAAAFSFARPRLVPRKRTSFNVPQS